MENHHNPSDKRKFRRLRLLQKGGLFTSNTGGSRSVRATTVPDLRRAYGLVHDVYVKSKFILEKSSGLRIRPFETSWDTATFVSKVEDDVVGVFSLIMDSEDLGLPSDGVFQQELDELRLQGKFVCEMSNQAVVDSYRSTAVSTQLMQCVFAQAWHGEATNLVCAISPGQRSFFEMIGFEQVGEIRSYSKTIDDPVAFMNLEDIENRWTYESLESGTINAFWKRFFITENPFMAAVPFWNDLVGRLYQYSDELVELFMGCDELFLDASVPQLAAMERRLGPAFFDLDQGSEALAANSV